MSGPHCPPKPCDSFEWYDPFRYTAFSTGTRSEESCANWAKSQFKLMSLFSSQYCSHTTFGLSVNATGRIYLRGLLLRFVGHALVVIEPDLYPYLTNFQHLGDVLRTRSSGGANNLVISFLFRLLLNVLPLRSTTMGLLCSVCSRKTPL